MCWLQLGNICVIIILNRDILSIWFTRISIIPYESDLACRYRQGGQVATFVITTIHRQSVSLLLAAKSYRSNEMERPQRCDRRTNEGNRRRVERRSRPTDDCLFRIKSHLSWINIISLQTNFDGSRRHRRRRSHLTMTIGTLEVLGVRRTQRILWRVRPSNPHHALVMCWDKRRLASIEASFHQSSSVDFFSFLRQLNARQIN